MVRRAVAAVVAIVLIIVIVLVINGCLKSEKEDSLKSYNRDVSQLASEYQERVAQPLFTALAGASGKEAIDVEENINQLRIVAQSIDSRAEALSVPGEMEASQRDLLLAFGLRGEGVDKLASLLPTALGGKSSKSAAEIAGDMENFLASDVIYTQRVVPLIQQTLSANSINNLSTSSPRFLPNIGWLEPNTVMSRITGQSTQTTTTTTSGTHGSALIGVSVNNNTLAAEPTLNHLTGGANPTFDVQVEDSGESAETNVKVDVTVTAGGKTFKGSHTIEKTEPGKTFTAEVPVHGIPTGVAAKVEVVVEAVPGETNLENNKGSFLAIFE